MTVVGPGVRSCSCVLVQGRHCYALTDALEAVAVFRRPLEGVASLHHENMHHAALGENEDATSDLAVQIGE